jgi:hypothetical protein
MNTETIAETIPADFAVQPIDPDVPTAVSPATCGNCGLTWDDGISTSWTPVPSGRCPFEYFHDEIIAVRLEQLRARLDAEDISTGELIELQGLAEHIEPGDVQLLEAAGVPEEHAYLSSEARTLLTVTAEAVSLGILTQEHREALDEWIIER